MDITNAKKREREQLVNVQRQKDGERIRELRDALQLSQEAFAKECGVSRISALLWESGKSSPAAHNWRQMAKLSRKALPSSFIWFLERAGIDREILDELLPEFEKLSRDSEQRIRKIVEGAGGELVNIPLLRVPTKLDKASLASPEGIERWISLPKELMPSRAQAFAIRVSALFVCPVFSLGDIVVIDASESDALKLDGKLVAAVYSPNVETKQKADMILWAEGMKERMGGTSLVHANAFWPFLLEGAYLGWLRRSSYRSGELLVIDSANIKVDDNAALSTLNFSIPLGTFSGDKDTTEGSGFVPNAESRLLGRVICWISAPEPLAMRNTENPSSNAIGEALQADLSQRGIPEKTYIDNGKDYRIPAKKSRAKKTEKK